MKQLYTAPLVRYIHFFSSPAGFLLRTCITAVVVFFQFVATNLQSSGLDSHPGFSFAVVAQIRSDVMQSVSTTIHVLLLNDTRFAPSLLDFDSVFPAFLPLSTLINLSPERNVPAEIVNRKRKHTEE